MNVSDFLTVQFSLKALWSKTLITSGMYVCRVVHVAALMMMSVDLYSALRRAPLLRYVSRCIVKRNVFNADRKDPMLSDGSRR